MGFWPALIRTKMNASRTAAIAGVCSFCNDFGTGFSTLSYLQRFPFRGLKVDRSVVTHLGTEAENPVLVKSILALADSLKLDAIAEGIETGKTAGFFAGQRLPLRPEIFLLSAHACPSGPGTADRGNLS